MTDSSFDKLTLPMAAEGVRVRLAEQLLYLLRKKNMPLAVLCIGSDHYIGDALGPLVGSSLKERGACVPIFGELERPVHADNLIATYEAVRRAHPCAVVLAVDACLGREDEIGNLELWSGGLEAGIAVGKRLPPVGDISLVGVVGASRQLGHLDLQNASLARVIALSRIIADAVLDAAGTYRC